MADGIYTSDGQPQGFRLSGFIYALDGTPIGRVVAEKAYRLDGSYVGAVVNNMIVDKPNVSRRKVPAAEAPEKETPPLALVPRRPVSESFPDCFAMLLDAEAAPGAGE